MITSNMASFYQWFIDWYKTNLDEVTIMISFPNELQPFKEDNIAILELLKPKDDFVIVEPYLKSILDKADEFDITMYVDPQPRYATRNTKEFFISWYKQFGFQLTDDKNLMKR